MKTKTTQPASVSRTARRTPLLTRVAKPLFAVHNLLAGPPMSEQERFELKVADSRRREYRDPVNSWAYYR